MEGRNLASALVYGVTYNNKIKQAIGEKDVLINAYAFFYFYSVIQQIKTSYREVFETLWNIYDGAFLRKW